MQFIDGLYAKAGGINNDLEKYMAQETLVIMG